MAITFALMLLAFFAGFYFNGKINEGITGNAVNVPDEENSNLTFFTKAICNYQNNSCVDVKISCIGNKVSGVELASDAKEFPADWEDPRNAAERERLCE